MATLPPKLYFRIGEVAGLVGVEPHVLRYWEREFRSIRPTKSAKGQRVYSRRDVENLMRVRDLLYADGFTIAGAKKKLQRTGAEPEAETEAGSRQVLRDGAPVAAPSVLADTASAGSSAPASVRAVSAVSAVSVALRAAETAPKASPGVAGRHVRAALQELRGEIEALLAELGG
jgi:DNA-binding transcriptional MerR regulator